MKQKRSAILRIVLVAIILLLGLFASTMPTMAYYTSGDNLKIQAVVDVASIRFQVWQSLTSDVQIKNTTYIDVSNGASNGEICLAPDTNYTVNLKLKNADTGTDSVGVKYKIEFFADKVTVSGSTATHTDVALNANISGYYAATASAAGFWYNSQDGYYYYVNNSSSHTSIKYPGGSNLMMMSTFNIPFASFANLSGANVKMVVTVEAINI